MKSAVTASILAISLSAAHAVTLKARPDPAAHQQAPYAFYDFKPWSACGLAAVQGVYSNGTLAGSSASAMWPIGPYVAVSAAHITPFIATPSNRFEKFLVGTNQYRFIKDLYVMGDDTIMYVIHTNAGPFPMWNKLWRGPYYQQYTNSRTISGFNFTSIDTEARVFTNAFMIVSGGNFANNGQVYAPAVSWEVATNTIVGPVNYRRTLDESVQMIPREDYRIETWARAYTNLGAGINNLLYGSMLYVIYDKHPEIPGYWPNFGARLGDSGSGLFIYQDGEWQLVGMVNNGDYQPGAQVTASVVDLALGWTTNFWNTVGSPSTYALVSSIKDTYIPTYGFYDSCNGVSPRLTNNIVVTNVFTNVIVSNVYVTNNITIRTNYVTNNVTVTNLIRNTNVVNVVTNPPMPPTIISNVPLWQIVAGFKTNLDNFLQYLTNLEAFVNFPRPPARVPPGCTNLLNP